MSAPSTIFRKVSLDRLASPEQLDQLLHVTDARGWAGLAGLGTLLAAAVAWGALGRIPEVVAGSGILVKGGGVYEVTTSAPGRVVDVAVDVGEEVSEGQVVARVAQDDLLERLEQARASLGALRADSARLASFDARDRAAKARFLAQQRDGFTQAVAAGEQSMRWLGEKVATQEELVRRGLITKSALVSTRQQYDAAREKVAATRADLTQLGIRDLEAARARATERQAADVRVRDQALVVRDLERQLRDATEVVAPQRGRVLEVMADRGGVVGKGEPVLSLDVSGRAVKDLEAVVYVPSTQGKRIRPGMTIQLAPSTVKQEEYGLMVGRVTYVSDFPATSRGMRRVLKNEALMGTLTGGDAPYEVHADLVADRATASRYKWTSGGGPPARIQSGTLATARIEVSARRPVELVIPMIRQQTGL